MHKAIAFIWFSLCVIGIQHTQAQSSVAIKSDPILDSIIDANISLNKTSPGMAGYRVQIFFGSERKSAQEARTKFLQMFPETEAYLIYQQPYFKVRIGDYRTKFEAHATYKKLINQFDKVFIVPDRINLPKD